jgi:exosortase
MDSRPPDSAELQKVTNAASLSTLPSATPTKLQWVLFYALTTTLYFRTTSGLVRTWWQDPNFSHGFLVPLFSSFVLWHRRRELSVAVPNPSNFGLVLIAGALLQLSLGTLGAELFLARTSMLFLIAGAVIYFFGWQMFRRILFPWAILFLMIPIPAIIFNQIVLPLQFLASRLATDLLDILAVPVLREGNVIRLPSMSLEVVEACSGIRSLMSLLTLAIVFGYFFRTRVWRRIALACAAVPITVMANGLRIMGTGLLGVYWDPDKAQGFFHEFSGLVIFICSMGMLYLLHLGITWTSKSLEAKPG